MKTYSFKDVAGSIDSPITISAPNEGEPIKLNFAYFDKDGVCWQVEAHGYRTKTGETRKIDETKNRDR